MNDIHPWQHYIPVDHNHLEESLREGINWARNNDAECESIARAARDYALHNLTFEKMHSYQASVLHEYAQYQNFTTVKLPGMMEVPPANVEGTSPEMFAFHDKHKFLMPRHLSDKALCRMCLWS